MDNLEEGLLNSMVDLLFGGMVHINSMCVCEREREGGGEKVITKCCDWFYDTKGCLLCYYHK